MVFWLWWLLANKVEREDYLKSQKQEKFLRAKGEGYNEYKDYIKKNTPRRHRPDTTLCFYDMGTDEHNAWRLGWLQAEEEEEIIQNTIALGPACEEFERALEYDAKHKTFGEWLSIQK